MGAGLWRNEGQDAIAGPGPKAARQRTGTALSSLHLDAAMSKRCVTLVCPQAACPGQSLGGMGHAGSRASGRCGTFRPDNTAESLLRSRQQGICPLDDLARR